MLKRLKSSQYVAVPNGVLYPGSMRSRQSRRYRRENHTTDRDMCRYRQRMLREKVLSVSVVVRTTNGTITGLDGDFSLSNVKEGDIIVISLSLVMLLKK